jgi:[ribosomal protein S5]-alanine N-acetyltransferase
VNSINEINLVIPVLETARLTIRPFIEDDLPAIHDILDHQLGDGETYETRQRWLEWTLLNYNHLAWLHQVPSGDRAIVIKNTGELIGACGLAPNTIPYGLLPDFQPPVETPENALLTIEWGLYYALSPKHQQRGYATEASQALLDYGFRQLRLRRIVATTARENLASQAVMKRLHMQIYTNPFAEPGWFQVAGIIENPYRSTDATFPAR